MAKTNKYTSINFNHIYEKTLPANSTSNSNPNLKTPSSSSSSTSFSYSAISSSNKTHGGRMLVLTRPTPKPISIPQPQPQAPVRDPARAEPGSDLISLRPLGRTGGGSPVVSQEREAPVPVAPPKPDKFVPPHLRPGFVGREERPGPEVTGQRNFGSPGRYGEERRPKSGGGHERMRKGGDHSDLATMNRPNSS
ncbi:hypothetical protein L484_010540 [Morus notabilis]|uniref:Uncharacterized protein n=1 Tax=Morus notabilis TaxID=981085 RepID=W9R312_9ROSA|nr:histone-lysine N-methyltransferase SETD1A [Morus notabilis]XP_024019797.1 histone-lysine N-methyltransferase SETD1A [Morus notabilis]EXB54960.1 hypothetical protein L484_010540 [Morus notabilis]